MAHILHIATECYPAAKAGGMGDVVGALPKYLIKAGTQASVVIPKYKTAWITAHSFRTINKGSFSMGGEAVNYKIQQLQKNSLGYPLYVVDIPGKFDRADIYLGPDGHGYSDEAERNMSFQIAILEWLVTGKNKFDLLHCHDHMTAMIPFLLKHGDRYAPTLSDTPTFFTIHNGQYRGTWEWSKADLIPDYPQDKSGLLDWDGKINNLALAIKCAWKITTVSPSYMQELTQDFDTLTPLIQDEKFKTSGILNGIDPDAWDPSTDTYLDIKLDGDKWDTFKSKNKNKLLKLLHLKSRRPLISYIGRLAHQKGVDVLLEAIESALRNKVEARYVILGTGDKALEEQILALAAQYPDQLAPIIAYDEKLSRLIYAGSDFLIMPSRFEPCGLNQLYSFRYGTIPIVRAIGGLKDTVPDISDGGKGIVFTDLDVPMVRAAIDRSVSLYKDKKALKSLREKIVELDFSWSSSARQYIDQYYQYIKA